MPVINIKFHIDLSLQLNAKSPNIREMFRSFSNRDNTSLIKNIKLIDEMTIGLYINFLLLDSFLIDNKPIEYSFSLITTKRFSTDVNSFTIFSFNSKYSSEVKSISSQVFH